MQKNDSFTMQNQANFKGKMALNHNPYYNNTHFLVSVTDFSLVLPLVNCCVIVVISIALGGYHFLPNGGGGMKKLGGHKKNRDFWIATHFNENFVQWNSPPKCIFSALRALSVTCFFNIVAPKGGS